MERNILYWTKRWIIQAQNESRSWKVWSSDASSHALQNTDKEQWINPPQYWETQDEIRLYCWCRRKHETKVRRTWTQTSLRSHHCKRDTVLCTNSFRCFKHSKFQMPRQQWRKMRETGENPGMAADESQKQERSVQGTRAEKFILRHWWISVILRIRSWSLNIKSTKAESCSVVTIVKNDSGSYAVFTEQGSSASQMTAAKIMDIISRLPGGWAGQAADAVSACTQVKMQDAPKLLKIPKSECPDFWIRLPRHKWPKPWSSVEDPVVPLERNLYGHPLAGLLWKRQFEKVLLEHGWEKF